MSARTELLEVRLTARTCIRPGAAVKIRPTRKGRHDGFVGTVRRIVETAVGVEVEVFGGPALRVPAVRTFPIDRLAATRLAPTHGRRVEETS